MLPTAGLLLPIAALVAPAQAATPLSIQVDSPAGGSETLELTPPFDHTLEAVLGKETHRLQLTGQPGEDIVATLTTERKGKTAAARTVEKTPPTPGNAMSFMVTWPSHKSSSLGGAPATWKLRVTASDAVDSARSEALRADWVPAPHPTHTADHARVKEGGRLFATATDVEPVAVWPADSPDLTVQVLEQQGGRLHVRRVTDRTLCQWPSLFPQVELEAWVELADLRRVLIEDAITVHPDGTATWLWAGAPVDRVGSDHLVRHQKQVVPSTAVVGDRFTPTLHPDPGSASTRVPPASTQVHGARATAVNTPMLLVERSPSGLVELALPSDCGRVVAEVSEGESSGGSSAVGVIGGTLQPGTLEGLKAQAAERVGIEVPHGGRLKWPDGRPAGRLAPALDDKPQKLWFTEVKPGPDGTRCGRWRPSVAHTEADHTLELCWSAHPAPAPSEAPAE